MQLTSSTIIGDIVKENFKTASLFDKHNIDFCCGGGKTIAQACSESESEEPQLISELEMLLMVSDPDSNYINNLSLPELCDYIEKRHHTYVRENIPFLHAKLEKLSDVHGHNHPELILVANLFNEAATNLNEHLVKEETVLFPFVKLLAKCKEKATDCNKSDHSIDIINELNDEHEAEGSRFEKISQITNNYTCPPDGCTTYRVTFEMLRDFEQDLHRHIHLENNILFKKAIILHKSLFKK